MRNSTWCLVYLLIFAVAMSAADDYDNKAIIVLCMAIMGAAYQVCRAVEDKK